MIRAIESFQVLPRLPESLRGLAELAYNLHWTWHLETVELFRRLDRNLWETTGHNPVRLLGSISQERYDQLAADEGFLSQLERVLGYLREYLAADTWFARTHERAARPLIAYFSMEFGLTECLPTYSGGLGTLAGDHLKSASELGLPLAGVGLMYRQGYFQQYLNEDGWQQEFYPDIDCYNLPLRLQRREDGAALTIVVPLGGSEVSCQIWRAQVGRVPLYLLDTNLPQNDAAARMITFQLYGGDQETRIQQEIVLGVGGMRALAALGMNPLVTHMNEGHSAFLTLERIRFYREHYGMSGWEASELTGCGSIFTTHTPVPAGIDEFPRELMEKHFDWLFPRKSAQMESFLSWGRIDRGDAHAPFNMAVMALRLADFANGVSRLHSQVSRRLWQAVWPEIPPDEIPIGYVTNGIHIRSWISFEMAGLFDRYLGPNWEKKPADQEIWKRVDEIPDEELWRTHERRRERLVAFARRRLQSQLERRGAPASTVEAAAGILDPEALTIGFARRFVAYKRATLLFQDVERLTRLLADPRRPVQLIFAGKAHPRDNEGKEMIRRIIHLAREEGMRPRVVFLENYDIALARYLVQGVDVWLNTPRRPLEASGTSGMKVCPNGGLNLSTLDGWWAEAYEPRRGWSIGQGEEYTEPGYQDGVESRALYELLEREVVPLFYSRGPNGTPREWLARVKASMRELCPLFNTNRMVQEYTEQFYLPALQRWRRLEADGAAPAREFAAWRVRVTAGWERVRVRQVTTSRPTELAVGAQVGVEAEVELGELTPRDVLVEAYAGPLDLEGQITIGQPHELVEAAGLGPGAWLFRGSVALRETGLSGLSVRVLPRHELMANRHELGLIRWAAER